MAEMLRLAAVRPLRISIRLRSVSEHGIRREQRLLTDELAVKHLTMQNAVHSNLERLILLLKDIGEDGCEAIGLLPIPSLRHCGYSQAPQNSLSFARTGGDGGHFSFLTFDDTATASWPVVMTVPMNFGEENLVVGADILEFLGLGLRHGYFELEQLLYKPDEAIAWLDDDSDQKLYSPHKVRALEAIKRTFKINPWKSHGPRIAELQADFLFI